jgi:hypothetical protein
MHAGRIEHVEQRALIRALFGARACQAEGAR